MSAPVRIEAEAWTDLRFATLARLLELREPVDALIRTARLWSWQTEHYTPDTPTYVVDLDTIESAIGPGAAAALVRARLADEEPEGYRIRGSRGRIEWLWKTRQAGRAGGEATKRKHSDKTGPRGQADGPAPLQASPSPLTPDLPPDQISDPSPPRAIVQVEPAPAAVAAPLPRREVVRERVWELLENVRTDLALELDLTAPPLLAFDPGRTELAMQLSLADAHGNLELLERQARHAIAIAAAEARRDRSLQWLTGAIFAERNFRRLVGMSLEDAARPRGPVASRFAPPTPSMPPRRKRRKLTEPPRIAPEDRAGPDDFAAARAALFGAAADARAGPTSAPPTTEEQPEPAKDTA
jgi:hypothetical protein